MGDFLPCLCEEKEKMIIKYPCKCGMAKFKGIEFGNF